MQPSCAPYQKVRFHSAIRKSSMSTILATAFLLLSMSNFAAPGAVMAMERDDLGRVLKIMPPNGTPEKYGNVILRKRSKKAGMPPAVFPHWLHRARYTCSVCHVELELAMRGGSNGISRTGCLSGKYCGACHDGKTAFTVKEDGGKKECYRCHLQDASQLDNKFRQFAAELPASGYGNNIDWQAALNQGKIPQKNSLSGNKALPPLPNMLKKPLLLGSGSGRSAVTFSHEEHNAEMDCTMCHPDIFNIKEKGTLFFSMETNIYGQYCGACHMRVAFPMNDCRRCHPSMSYME